MTKDDRPAFVAMMKRLALTFSKPLDDALLVAYFDALDDVPMGYLEDAAREHCRHGQRWPVPSELRAIVADLKRSDVAEREAQERRARLAWMYEDRRALTMGSDDAA